MGRPPHVYWATKALRPGTEAKATDVCVPISRLAEAILAARDDAAAAGLIAPIVGHVGDGNFHMTFLLDPDDPSEFARANALNARLVERAIAMGGVAGGCASQAARRRGTRSKAASG